MTPEIPGVKGLVARLLLQDPDLTAREIHGRAVERYPRLDEISLREFNARYVLQVKRNMVGRKPRRPLPVPGENGTRPEPAPPSRNGADDREEGLDLLRRAAADARHSFRPSPTAPSAERPLPSAAPDPSVSVAGAPAAAPARAAVAASPGARLAEDASPEQEERTPPREALRVLFFKLALELELTRNDSELVDVIAGVDRYVDEALAAVSG